MNNFTPTEIINLRRRKLTDDERSTHTFRSHTGRLGHWQEDPAHLSRIRCDRLRLERSDRDRGTDDLQRDENHR